MDTTSNQHHSSYEQIAANRPLNGPRGMFSQCYKKDIKHLNRHVTGILISFAVRYLQSNESEGKRCTLTCVRKEAVSNVFSHLEILTFQLKFHVKSQE